MDFFILALLLLLLLIFLLSAHLQALQICINEEAPLSLKQSLAFCSSFQQNDLSCCDASMDEELQIKFQSFNVSSTECATYLKQILCAQCDPYAGELFQIQLQQVRSTPILCNSTSEFNTTQSSNQTTNYCQSVWDACKSTPIKNSPFSTSLQGPTGTSQSTQNTTILTDIWQLESDFCASIGGIPGPGEFCYSGEKFVPYSTNTSLPKLEGICFEKIADNAYLNMIPHPDGSNRVFLASQEGVIYLATLPTQGPGNISVNMETPFLDISTRVISSSEYGLLGVAFHPNFKENGRFFVSYNCDKSAWADCGGRCACTNETGCSLSALGSEAGTVPCQVSSVISEYSTNSSSTSSPFEAVTANPNEVRRIFTMGLPYQAHHGGQILFGPTDNYLYFMMGDGGSSGDPFNFAQNKKSLLGKIMRFDIDTISVSEQLWGNYSIPADNPFVQDNSSQPEIWAYGLRNPWRCSFDKINPSYFYCADVGQESFEEVNLITKGGNYGWRVYEGTKLYVPPRSPGGNTNASSINPIFPVLEYTHDSVNAEQNSASITGGYVSRSTQDACLYGRYVYGDLYGGAMWAGWETPPGSGNFTTGRVTFSCSKDSPMPCNKSENNSEPNFLYLFSYGEDNDNNLYALSQMGIFKVVDPKGCGFTCNAKFPSNVVIPSPSASPSSPPPPSPTPTSSPSSSPSHSSFLNWVCHLALTLIFLLFVSN